MLAEAIDLGVVTVGGMVGLLGVVAAGTWWAASASAKLTSIAKDTSTTARGQRELARALDDHRAEDDAKHGHFGERLIRIEAELSLQDRTPIRGIPLDPRQATGPQAQLRGDTPKPRRREDTGETGSGFER